MKQRIAISFFMILCGVMSSCLIGDSAGTTEGVDLMMVYDGHVFRSVKIKSLCLNKDDIELKGKKNDEFILRCNGIGSEGGIRRINNDPAYKKRLCTLSLELNGKLKTVFIATKGSIKRSFNRIEIDVSGITDASTSLQDIKKLSAVIVLNPDSEIKME